MSQLKKQIERLSPAQRVKLAEQLAGPPGTTRLLAYATPGNSDRSLDCGALKVYLEARLPAYMVPASIIELQELPHLPNGKIDRSKLPRPAVSEKLVRSGTKLTELEEQLLSIWQNVLGFDEIWIGDNFFEIGGDSILAMQLLVSIRNELQLSPEESLSSADLLNFPTISKLALRLGSREEFAYECLVPIQENRGAPTLFCTHVRGGQVIFYKKLAKYLPKMAIYGLEPVGANGNADPLRSFEEMAARYIEEMRSFQPQGPYHIAGYCTGAALAFEIAQQLHQVEEDVGQVILIDPTFSEKVLKAKSFAPFRRFHQNFVIHGGNAPAVYTVLKDFTLFRLNRLKEALTSILSPRVDENPTLEDHMNKAFDLAFSKYSVAAYPNSVVFVSSHETRIRDQYYFRKGSIDYLQELVPNLDVISLECRHTEFFDEPQVELLAQVVREHL
jgi:aspartate racemase